MAAWAKSGRIAALGGQGTKLGPGDEVRRQVPDPNRVQSAGGPGRRRRLPRACRLCGASGPGAGGSAAAVRHRPNRAGFGTRGWPVRSLSARFPATRPRPARREIGLAGFGPAPDSASTYSKAPAGNASSLCRTRTKIRRHPVPRRLAGRSRERSSHQMSSPRQPTGPHRSIAGTPNPGRGRSLRPFFPGFRASAAWRAGLPGAARGARKLPRNAPGSRMKRAKTPMSLWLGPRKKRGRAGRRSGEFCIRSPIV